MKAVVLSRRPSYLLRQLVPTESPRSSTITSAPAFCSMAAAPSPAAPAPQTIARFMKVK